MRFLELCTRMQETVGEKGLRDGGRTSPPIFADFRFRKLSKNFGKKVGPMSREDVWTISGSLVSCRHFVLYIYILFRVIGGEKSDWKLLSIDYDDRYTSF